MHRALHKAQPLEKESLKVVYSFYMVNKMTFDGIRKEFVGFNGEGIGMLYPMARLVDMYGFDKGEQLREEAIERKKLKNQR